MEQFFIPLDNEEDKYPLEVEEEPKCIEDADKDDQNVSTPIVGLNKNLNIFTILLFSLNYNKIFFKIFYSLLI